MKCISNLKKYFECPLRWYRICLSWQFLFLLGTFLCSWHFIFLMGLVSFRKPKYEWLLPYLALNSTVFKPCIQLNSKIKKLKYTHITDRFIFFLGGGIHWINCVLGNPPPPKTTYCTYIEVFKYFSNSFHCIILWKH